MHDVPLITTVAAAFLAAWLLGLLTHRLGLSPIVGYLLAGVAIGPFTPGVVADADLAAQLAEIGVILLMFGVGLHFHPRDLLAVKGIAIPGAVGQSLVATLAGMTIFMLFGWPITAGIVLGLAMAVASTVVLMRVLTDHDMLTTVHGRVAVGWLIVEDIFTVIVLVLLPMLAGTDANGAANGGANGAAGDENGSAGPGLWTSLAWAIGKLLALTALMLLAGSRIVPWILVRIAKLRSRELFTLTVLVLSITVAAGASMFFGASLALGAFLAGMVVGQSPVSHQAAADALPMRDAFAVLFFVSVGMLFDPSFLIQHPAMVLAGLAIVMVAKPLAALVIVSVLGYSVRTALTVAVGLAQIGEFSFILSDVARHYGLLPGEGHNVLVACALVSISINPLLFGSMDAIERRLRRWPAVWRILNARVDRGLRDVNAAAERQIKASERPRAIIVGYGLVGRSVDRVLRQAGLETVVIELNMETVQELNAQGRAAIFGDASHMEILAQAGIERARHLVVTLPHASERAAVVTAARQLNPSLDILARARYVREREELDQAGVNAIVFEEVEAAITFVRIILTAHGADHQTIHGEIERMREQFSAAKREE